MGIDGPRYLLLGPVTVLDERGEPLDLGGAQRRAVLAQLALVPGRVVSVDSLSLGLWDGDPPPTAVKSIQVHISRLRSALSPGALLTRSPGYLLDAPSSATDVAVFEEAVSLARDHAAHQRPDQASDLLRSALARWRGEALADVADHPFAVGATARLGEARLQAIALRLDADLALGRHRELVGELEALVHAHPTREHMWGQLMTALYRCGRQADALDAFARARHQLVEQLGIDPGVELQRLEREVLDQTLPPPQGPTSARLAPAPPPPALARSPHLVVGRAEPLARLDAALDGVQESGRGAVAVVTGDEGMGKTSLLATFATALAGRSEVLAGTCGEQVAVPFGPWDELIRYAGEKVDLRTLAGTEGDEPPERHRAQLFAGIVEWLRDRAGDLPVVVVIDDLHWSDDASVSLIQHSITELQSAPILFVLAWRDREIRTGHPVTRLVHQLSRSASTQIELGPLDVDDVVRLLADLPGAGQQAEVMKVAEALHAATSGVPLFVAGAISSLRENDGLADPALAIETPETVRTLVTRRLTEAGPAMTAVAEACALLTEPIDDAVLDAVVPELEQRQILLALDGLVDAGLVDEVPGGHAFRHAAFRHAIVAGLRSGRQQTLHAAAYTALVGAGGHPAVVAHHGERAGRLVPPDEVLIRLHEAGTDAAGRGAFLDAADLFGREVLRSGPAGSDRASVALADALWRAGNITASKAAAAAVVARAGEPALEDRLLVDAVARHGVFASRFGLDPASLAAADRAIEVVTDPLERARALAARAYHHAMWGSPVPVSLEAADEAVAACPDEYPPRVLGEVLFAEGIALMGTARLEQRFTVANRLLDLGHRTGVWRDVGRALRLRCLTEMSAGRLTALDSSLDELFDAADRTGSWLYRSDAWRWRIAGALAGGDADGAARALAELERISASPLAGRAFTDTQRIFLHWVRGDMKACLAYIDGMRESLPPDPEVSPDRRLTDLLRLAALVDADRRDEAHDEFVASAPQRHLDLASCRSYPGELALIARLVAEFSLADLAPPLIERLEPFRGQLLVLSWGEGPVGSADRHLAQLTALMTGEVDDAAFAAAAEFEQTSGAVVDAERTRAAWRRASELSAAHTR